MTTQKPVWLRVRQAVALYGLSRSHLYELIKHNKIKSSKLRKPGNTLGVRLIHAESLDAFIDSHSE